MKYKVGDLVELIDTNGQPYLIDQIGKFGKVVRVSDFRGGFVSVDNPDLRGGLWIENVKLMEKTMDNLVQGDILVRKEYGYTFEVQGKIGKVYIGVDEDDEAVLYTAKQLESYEYEIKQEETTTEVTLEEVAEKMGIPLENLRIKD